jgi:hypothetical protein
MLDGGKSKKERILEAARLLEISYAGRPEIRAIEAYLVRQYGLSSKPSSSYIFETLRGAGFRVAAPFGRVNTEDSYAARLKGLLHFQTIESAEESLRNLHAAYEEYRQAGDHPGMRRVRDLAVRGKQRAASIARNPRVDPAKRRVKLEIAHWFRVWLESPDLFFVWAEVRKNSEEYQKLRSYL